MTTYDEAIDAMYGVFRNAWQGGAQAVAGYLPDVEYDEPIEAGRASIDRIFARLTVRNVNEGILGFGQEQVGRRLYETVGLLGIQIFVPKKQSNGVFTGRGLAMLVRDAYRSAGTGGQIWFQNATISEFTPDDRWRRFSVQVEYAFTETA